MAGVISVFSPLLVEAIQVAAMEASSTVEVMHLLGTMISFKTIKVGLQEVEAGVANFMEVTRESFLIVLVSSMVLIRTAVLHHKVGFQRYRVTNNLGRDEIMMGLLATLMAMVEIIRGMMVFRPIFSIAISKVEAHMKGFKVDMASSIPSIKLLQSLYQAIAIQVFRAVVEIGNVAEVEDGGEV